MDIGQLVKTKDGLTGRIITKRHGDVLDIDCGDIVLENVQASDVEPVEPQAEAEAPVSHVPDLSTGSPSAPQALSETEVADLQEKQTTPASGPVVEGDDTTQPVSHA